MLYAAFTAIEIASKSLNTHRVFQHPQAESLIQTQNRLVAFLANYWSSEAIAQDLSTSVQSGHTATSVGAYASIDPDQWEGPTYALSQR